MIVLGKFFLPFGACCTVESTEHCRIVKKIVFNYQLIISKCLTGHIKQSNRLYVAPEPSFAHHCAKRLQ